MTKECGLRNCDYVVPDNYNPQYGVIDKNGKVLGADRAYKIFKNCLTLRDKESFYVGNDGTLKGYHWLNFPERILLWIRNLRSGNTIHDQTVRKITETFEFILCIRNDIDLDNDIYWHELGCTTYSDWVKVYYTYTDLAQKVIRKYPREDHKKLYNLAHRILHERAHRVVIEHSSKHYPLHNSKEEVWNTKSNVCGTPYEKTTVWG